MRRRAHTRAFDCAFVVDDDTLSYEQSMQLAIYGREFDHTDRNALTRTG